VRPPLAGEPSSRLRPPAPGTPGSVALHALAEVMRQPLERYFITLSVLCGQGSDRLGARALEDLCALLAQRMAYLHEASSPGFVDRASFRAVIATLAELGWIRERDGRLGFGEALAVAADDAPMLLSGEVRRAIAQLTRLSPDDVARAQAALEERAR
jgi:glycerol-3-phosphate O-acyltransferase